MFETTPSLFWIPVASVSAIPLASLSEGSVAILGAALIAAVAPTLAVYFSHRRAATRIEQIHVLVNSRLTQALAEINSLKATLDKKDIVLAEQRAVIRENT